MSLSNFFVVTNSTFISIIKLFKASDASWKTFVVVQSLSHTRLFLTPWTVAHQTSLSFTISWSLLKLMSIELVMPSNHLILCCSCLLLPSIFPSINVKKILPPVVSLDLLFDRFEFGKWIPLITGLQTISSGIRIFTETISMNSWGFSLFKNIEKINLQNIQSAHAPQYQKNKQPNQKMCGRSK